MATKTINSELLAKMFLAGAQNIEVQKAYINELNVFPVPDGDTGTNMSLTIMSAAKEVKGLKNPTMQELSKAISSGSLRGARGNSGVILSQLLRGFTKVIREEEEVDAITLAAACIKAKETAYKAVMKPKEGTILTVASGIADKAIELSEDTEDLEVIIPGIIAYAEEVLASTPDLLPVLKEAGVVDSGGQGLLEILKGGYDAFLGKEIDYSSIEVQSASPVIVDSEAGANIEFGYCTEFIVNLEKDFREKDEDEFKEYLSSIGDSIVCVSDDDVVKIHVHTNDPGLAIQKGLSYGSLSRMKIDNMREEHQEKLLQEMKKQQAQEEEQPWKEVGFISVSIGEGINKIFKELGVDFIIEGGQTMNPSTEDMLHAIEEVKAKSIFILPNNKNIILAANQAKDLTKDKEIIVIPTKSIPQGISAMISYSPEMDREQNQTAMQEEINHVKTGSVTYAVRDTHIDDKDINEGDIMGIGDTKILAVGQDIRTTSEEMLENLIDEDSELISIYYGAEVAAKDAEEFAKGLEEKYGDLDIDLQYGGQPIYYYVMSVE
ncbi:DAK2 domain fusion protein YloV [Aequitasia blattaphilus]|uniref:DAK2 domain-containing protein n=1 Tax=Aequitasia blattaphilus TaxID=2949332 RepID=A0ABT1E5I9_9FIRM|nr:DAK2 domain-containing protein [Aequitasia blattaphilus]MCP1101101.1 DAK2 domain-containing protein [Aequitasia blattaphilus]MCR8613741.1 DAK2 domain-containing protein [Aequitasia blattaphilus]